MIDIEVIEKTKQKFNSPQNINPFDIQL